MNMFFVLLTLYYVSSYALVLGFIQTVMQVVYQKEGLPIPWGRMIAWTTIPFIGCLIAFALMFADFAGHVASEAIRNSKNAHHEE